MLTKKKELYNRRRQRSEIDRILQKQRAFFAEGKTYEIRFRKAALKRLEASILAHEKEVCQALTEDLGKSETEGYMCEVGLTLAEIRGLYRNVKAYSKTKRVPVSMANFPAKGYLVQEPYGVTLVMSPWNYPFMLAMEPLAGAIAAGNCCVVKPSAYAPATSAVLAAIVKECFPEGYVAVIEGGRQENQELLEQRFDYIFFTGSVSVGKLVMEKDLNYRIATSLKSYLEQYDGIKVILTRNENQGLGLIQRIDYAVANEADYFISVHVNSRSTDEVNSHGCMVLMSCSRYQPVNTKVGSLYDTERGMALSVISKLNRLGLPIANDWNTENTQGILQRVNTVGATYPDGSQADYYTLLYCGTEAGLPTIIIEHAFLSNENDYRNFLCTNDKLDALAKADAEGIIESIR